MKFKLKKSELIEDLELERTNPQKAIEYYKNRIDHEHYINSKLKEEIKNLKKQISALENNINTHDTKKSNSSIENKKMIGINDEILYEFRLNEYLENKIKNLDTLYEYEENLNEKTNLMRKIILKEFARKLTYDKNYNEAIIFYNHLKTNSYFKNDWYPYRQLTIIYDKTNDYAANIENIKELFLSGIYLNKYQYVWFTNKLKIISEKISVNENEFQKWLDYYELNGAKNKSKLNKFLADQFTKHDETIKVLNRASFDYRQEIYGLEEIGKINEKAGNFELAIAHYTNIIDEKKYNIYKFYQRICLCLEKMNDFSRELDAIKLYYTQPPQQITEYSDKWFEKRLMKVNSQLGTKYKVNNFKN